MTELAVRGADSTLAIHDGQTNFTDDQVAILRQIGLENANDADLAVFFHQCARTGLDPFARQIYMIGRNQKNNRTNQWETKYTIQTGIDGYRLIARRVVARTGEHLGYEDTLWCGEDGQWTDVWLKSEAPAAAKVTVVRNGNRFPAVAKYTEYVQTTRDGSPNSMWSKMGANQLAKCAEALALRKAFPQDLSGIYTAEEMGQAENEAPAPAQQQGGRQFGIRANMPQGRPAPEDTERRDAYGRLTVAFDNAGIPKDARGREAIDWAANALGRDIKSAQDLTVDEVGQLAAYFEDLTTPAQDVEADAVTGEVLDWDAQEVPQS